MLRVTRWELDTTTMINDGETARLLEESSDIPKKKM